MRLAQILPLTIVAFTLAAGQTRGQSQDAAAHWPQWEGADLFNETAVAFLQKHRSNP